MLHGNVKTFDLIFKTMEESTRAVELALEGQILFISGQNTILNLNSPQRSVRSQLLTASLFLAAVSFWFFFSFFLNISAREKSNRWEPV